MKFRSIIAPLILIPVFLIATITTEATSLDHYLLSCDDASNDANTPSDWDGLVWDSDNNKTYSASFSSTTVVSATTTINIPKIPFSTARIFTSNFTYSFPVSPGPKFIRLFFFPTNYSSSISAVDSYLTVKSNSGHLLLRNFSAYLSLTPPSKIVEKEFYVNVAGSHLQLTFYPTSPSSHAFVNGIEVVSVPENLYAGQPKEVAHQDIPFDLLKSTALETAYRLNVGGSEIGRKQDSGNIYRYWERDTTSYMTGPFNGATGLTNTKIIYTPVRPSYTAPEEVYQSYRLMGNATQDMKTKSNMTWEFEVDLGFYYLVRLHWCELVVDINASNYRVFKVYIDHQTAEENLDIYEQVGIDRPLFIDYIVFMDEGHLSNTGGVLQVALHPYTDSSPKYTDVLLNGLEIYKLSRTNGSLDAPNRAPVITPIDHTPSPRSSSSHFLPAIIGAISGAIVLSVFLCYIFIIMRSKRSKLPSGSSSKSKRFLRSGKSDTTKRSGGGSSSLPSHLCQYFSLEEIKLATSDFSESLIIGHGGFGNVYKGTVNTGSGPTTVAIKRLNPLSNQGAREFAMEIQLLSKLRHLHLVSLIGYCDAAGEMILIYEYMSHGTLRDHLFPHNVHPNAHLPWFRRLEICAGAARGLHYLHSGTERMVIHRDVKSTNILLDERWVAKVSDFGLSKLGPAGDDLVSHVSTVVKGSFGYVDPEYYRRQQLTEKSDVYSFGVVLFEVLCGRAAVNPNLPKEQVNLRIWARRNQLSGTLDTIVDPVIKGQISPECLRKFGDVAESCVRDEGVLRPSMADVIAGLELAIQIQSVAFVPKSVDQVLSGTTTTTNGTDQVDDDLQFPTTSPTSKTTDTTVRLIKSAGESTWTSMNNSSTSFSNTASEPYGGSTDVFSQIFKADGR